MRKTREILRLRYQAALSMGKIALSCGVSSSTVSDTLNRFRRSGLPWPVPAELDCVFHRD